MCVLKVERVVAKRIQRRETAYFVEWKHYSPEQNTWEPADHLEAQGRIGTEKPLNEPFRFRSYVIELNCRFNQS